MAAMASERVTTTRQFLRGSLEERVRTLSPAGLSRFERLLRRGQIEQASGAIPPRRKYDTVPLSFGQERLWFLDQLIPGDPTYNLAMLTPLKNVSVPALKRCLYEITRRHESLRTTFAISQGKPVQRIQEPFVPYLTERELRGLTGDKLRSAWREFSRQETSRPFDLTRGPLFRACLYRHTETDFTLQCVMHHIISDGWSLQILEREIRALLDAYSRFDASPLEPLGIQFGDYAAWQREQPATQDQDADLCYWREHLRNAPPIIELPFSKPRAARPTTAGASRYFTVAAATAEAVKDLCEGEATTSFAFFLAVFKLLIAKYTGRDDIPVGVPFAGRTKRELAPLVGFFVNTLVLRTHLNRAMMSFRDLLQHVRDTSLAALAHQNVPFEWLVNDLGTFRALDHNPVFQLAFSLETGMEVIPEAQFFGAALASSSFDVSQVLRGVYESRSKFDLTVQMASGQQGLWGVCEYRTDLYVHNDIEDLLIRFLDLADRCVANPDAPLAAIPIAEDGEARVARFSPGNLHPWQVEVSSAQEDFLEAMLLDADGLPVPPGAIGRLHLLKRPDATRTPTEIAAVRGKDGRLTCLGPMDDQILVNGRRVNLAALRSLLGTVASVSEIQLTYLRRKDGRDAILARAIAEDPQTARQDILASVREHYPWLAADLHCRLRLAADEFGMGRGGGA